MYNLLLYNLFEFCRIYLLLTFQMRFSQNNYFAMFAYINECLDKITEAIHLISFAIYK